MIPAKVPYHPEWALNFSMPGYFCSSAPLLLAQRDQGKRCQFVMYVNKDMPNYDISSVNAPFYEAFDRCSNVNCTTINILYAGEGNLLSSFIVVASHQMLRQNLQYCRRSKHLAIF
ncbi:uncharacterized protein LOC108673297 [Hyalella azteca]|uniref:Uncharacterized protein LOC108673297 n=1 Tax=Hyalella azteca TaxID=294128 RepID=A0A979FUV0_HYAAZ|nr:uncharacterized protein LOC108673297 [Hyalella azteca]